MDDKDIVVCRCEDITLHDLKEMYKRGYTSIEDIKRISRCGMGPCQGKTCRDLVIAELSRALSKTPAEILSSTFRPPTKPVKLGAIADSDGDSHEK